MLVVLFLALVIALAAARARRLADCRFVRIHPERLGRRLRRMHPIALLRLARELQLDPTQRDQVREILRAAHHLRLDARRDRSERLDVLAEALREPRFDRARIDQAVAGQREKHAAAERELLDRVQLFHEGLTTEQRDLLARHLARMAPPRAKPAPN